MSSDATAPVVHELVYGGVVVRIIEPLDGPGEIVVGWYRGPGSTASVAMLAADFVAVAKGLAAHSEKPAFAKAFVRLMGYDLPRVSVKIVFDSVENEPREPGGEV